MLGLRWCVGFFSSCHTQGLLSSCGTQASHCSGFSCFGAQALGQRRFSGCGTWTQQLWLLGSITQAQKLWCMGCSSMARGIFSDQGSNLCLLHWQVDSLPLSHQGSTPSANFPYYIWILLCTVMAISCSMYSTTEHMVSALKENRKTGQAGDRDIYP